MGEREKPSSQNERLDLVTWCRSAKRLYDHLKACAGAIECERVLRRAFFLSKLLPEPFWSEFSAVISEGKFEDFLEKRNHDQAAIALLNESLVLETTRPNGTVCIRLRSPVFQIEATFEARDLPQAIVGAWLSCLFALIAESIAQQAAVNTDQHRLQPVPHLPPTVH